MSTIVYRIRALLTNLVVNVPIGTNLGLVQVLFALISGRFLLSRGALTPALADIGLQADAVRRAHAALCYGRWKIADLLKTWQHMVWQEGRFRPHAYQGYRPVACDLVGFFRPHLLGCVQKHYLSQANKALPAVTLGMVASVGSVGKSRLALPRLLVEGQPGDTTDAAMHRRTLIEAAKTLTEHEVLIVDAGFSLADLLLLKETDFVWRAPKNFTAQRDQSPVYIGRGRPPIYGEVVRPLARTYNKKELAATPPDRRARWKDGKHTIHALLFDNLVANDAKPGDRDFRCVVILDPRYKDPLVLVTVLPVIVTAHTLWCLYRDRWPIEQLPLAAKAMLGAERSFVFHPDSLVRLPQLALLAGNVLSYVAASSAPERTGFWDRCARATCGRLRRVLWRVDFSDLALPGGQVRKKSSVTGHLPKGVQAHRRTKATTEPLTTRLAA